MDRDLTPDEFREAAKELADWIAEYRSSVEQRPVVPRVRPGELADKLPASAPDEPAAPSEILAELDRDVMPHVLHWAHPGFMGYFAAGGSGPGVLGETLSASLNNVGMLWRTSPASTELEQVTLSWLAQWLGLPGDWFGVTHHTASEASLHAVIAAREQLRARDPKKFDLNRLVMYTSEHAHSSIEKTMLALGHGREACRKIAVNERFEMRPDSLEQAIEKDLADGLQPIAVCATIGTTSTSSVDPVEAIADVAERYRLWLHVDSAYAGPCAMLPEMRGHFAGVERADSYLMNPHKWMFSPMGLSCSWTRRPEVFRDALSLTPEYLRSAEDPRAVNLMEYSVPLGRPFRALKLYYLMRAFGRRGIEALLRRHCEAAWWLERRIEEHARFENLAPVPFSLVCFRARPEGMPEDEVNAYNERLMEKVNDSGEFLLSHTKLNGRFTIRAAVGQVSTEQRHVERLWALLLKLAD